MANFPNVSKFRRSSVPEIHLSPTISEKEIIFSPILDNEYSDIHNFVIAALPKGRARSQILGGIIDFETPVNTRPSSPIYLGSRRSSVVRIFPHNFDFTR